MDSDLQHPPEMLPAMIERWRMGFDVVSMVRDAAEHEGFLKAATSRWFYLLINSVSEVKIKSAVADFRLLTAVWFAAECPERTRAVRARPSSPGWFSRNGTCVTSRSRAWRARRNIHCGRC